MSGLTDDKLRALLGKRAKAELVEWIVTQAAGNEDLRRALLGFIAPQADAKMLAAELGKTISRAWGRTRTSREPWKVARPIAADLEPVLAALEQLIEHGGAAAAEPVLRRLVEGADAGFAHVDDSYGYLGPVCQEAVVLWGKAWAKIEPRDPKTLARLVFAGVRDNDYGIRDQMIRDFAPALGRAGLLALKDMFVAEDAANRANEAREEWERRRPLRHLADVADALGDVDLYIDVQRQCGAVDIYALPIARRLLDAGRAATALEFLDRADGSRKHFQGEVEDYAALRSRILHALGRDDEARDTLWQEFGRGLNATALARLMTLTPGEKQPALVADALALAEGHPNKLAAALFLVERGQTSRAATIIDAHPDQFDGRCYGTVLPLAETLQREFPASAWTLYRNLLLSILAEKRSQAYHHAADYLALANGLAIRAGLREQQEELLALLRQEHGRKYAFWRLVGD